MKAQPAGPAPSLEGLSPLDAERAESMASEGGRSAQLVEAGPRRSAPRNRWPLWLALSVSALAVIASYRRLSQH